jgi:NAD-dependent deacetylase
MEESRLEELIERIAELILQSRRVVVFTGAGVSTESGIPDFRSPGGIWTRYNPSDFTFQKFISDPEARKKAWGLYRELWQRNAQPNPAHYAIAELEKLGKLDCVITQNIDFLHQKAGNSEQNVIELHGTIRWVICLDCGKRYPFEEIKQRLDRGEESPSCGECGGMLKTATISFGQAMPVREMREAEHHSRNCDLFIVVGSSLVVYPAAYMPVYALESGAKLVIINATPTSLDPQAEVVVHARAGEVLPRVVDRVKRRMQSPA